MHMYIKMFFFLDRALVWDSIPNPFPAVIEDTLFPFLANEAICANSRFHFLRHLLQVRTVDKSSILLRILAGSSSLAAQLSSIQSQTQIDQELNPV